MSESVTDSLVRKIEEKIISGAYEIGQYIPPTRVLAEQEGVSRGMVTSAVSVLVGRGFLERVPRKGFRVVEPSERFDGQEKIRSYAESAYPDKNKTAEIVSRIFLFDSAYINRMSNAFLGKCLACSSLTEDKYSLLKWNLSRNVSVVQKGELISCNLEGRKIGFDASAKEYAVEHIHHNDSDVFLDVVSKTSLIKSFNGGKREYSIEYREVLADKSTRWIELQVELMTEPDTSDIIAFILCIDIEAQKHDVPIIFRSTGEDELTGLLTRRSFVGLTDELFEKSEESAMHSLLLIDIDGFTAVNDVFGHTVGDKILSDLGKSIRSLLRHGDIVCRLGSDHFIICVKELPYKDVAINRAKQLNSHISRYIGDEVYISASIGVAIFPQDGRNFDKLYKCASSALAEAKKAGKNMTVVYGDKTVKQEQPNEGTPSVRPRVLVGADERTIRNQLVDALKEDYEVIVAEGARMTVPLLRRYGNKIAAAVFYFKYFSSDGPLVFENIKREPILHAIPVIVLGDRDDRNTELLALKEGATDYMTRPVVPEIISLRVKNAIMSSESDIRKSRSGYMRIISDDIQKYRAVLNGLEIAVIEFNSANGEFKYDEMISEHIDGRYDDRQLWRILIEDAVTDTTGARNVRDLIFNAVNDPFHTVRSIIIRLKSANSDKKWFKMSVIRQSNESKNLSKIYITVQNVNSEVEKEKIDSGEFETMIR